MELATIRGPHGATAAAVRRGDEWMGLAAANLSELVARPDWSREAVTALAAPAGSGVPADEVELAVVVGSTLRGPSEDGAPCRVRALCHRVRSTGHRPGLGRVMISPS
jgi:hypothetical protein